MKLRLFGIFAALLIVTGCAGVGGNAGGNSVLVTKDGREIKPGGAEDFVARAQDRVFFSFDRYSLNREAVQSLKAQAAWLKTYKDTKIVIEGHCDERGTREYNIALGDRRANSVKDFLVSQGIAASRVRTISYGKERPAVMGHNEASWSQNRRSVTVIVE
jgi:peptidoglycan-associated lipoprotein